MFKSVKEQDSFKNTQTHYYLTQGDSCTITATPYKNGVVENGVTQCAFRLATSDYKQVKEIIITEKSTNGSFVINLSSSDTALLNAGTYIYEIEYTIGNEVQTPHSWKFDILKQIVKPKTTE